MISRWGLVLVLVAWGGASGVTAQDREDARQGRRDRWDEAVRMVDAYVIANIQESLDLDDDTYVKVIPLVNRLQKVRREFFGERMQQLRRMRRLLQSGTATEKQVQELLESFKTLEVEGPERIRTRTEELDALLTPLQQAKYRVFEVDVEHRLKELMRRGRQGRPDGGAPKE